FHQNVDFCTHHSNNEDIQLLQSLAAFLLAAVYFRLLLAVHYKHRKKEMQKPNGEVLYWHKANKDNSGQMIVVQVIWKCLYMTGVACLNFGMKHVWLISDDEDLDDEGQHEWNTVPTPRHWSQKWKFLQTLHIKWLGSKTLVTTTSSINPFSQIKNLIHILYNIKINMLFMPISAKINGILFG
ncbi:hypothetical protein ACJX0J_028637, partial [Zea mays]